MRRQAAVLAVALASLLLAAGIATAQDGPSSAADPVALRVFVADGCPYCAAEKEWLEGLQHRYPDLVVEVYEVSGSAANRDLWVEMTRARGLEPSGVPTTVLGDDIWVGFDEATIAPRIERAVAVAVSRSAPEPSPAPVDPPVADTTISVPLLGEVDVGNRSLVLSTLIIGFVDGVNPCSLWVLSLLLALVLHTRSRRRVLIVGGTFLLVTTVLYGVYIAGLYSVLSYIAYITWIRVGVAAIAGTVGVIGIKDYFAFRRGPTLSIPESRKPGLFRRMREVTAADRPLPSVIAGTTVMAVGVSLIETPCTVGLPVVWSNLLAAQGVGSTGAVALFALYMLVFLIDELLIFGAAVVTMRAAKLQERHGRLLKLVGGVVMVTLAAVMIVAPELLESVTGTAGVFAAAAAVTALTVWITKLVSRAHPAAS